MIKYVYEHQGVESQPYLLEQHLGRTIITAHELLDMLMRDGVECQPTQIKVFAPELGAYISLPEVVEVHTDLKVLIRSTQSADLITLLSRVDALERQLSMLTQRPELIHVGSFNRHESVNVKPEENQLDLAVLNAAPLIKKDLGNVYPLPDSNLDFESEKRDLVEFFRQRNIGLDIKFEAATLSNLIDLMELQPKILQIDCHGIYTPNCSKFFLAFEHFDEVGVLEMIDAERLRNTLLWNNENPDMIVLVNACYSEAIASVFLEAGVPCVIAVHNECKIMDEAARYFEKEFYRELFRGASINEAFQRAQTRISGAQRMESEACCCAHTHKSDCLWRRETLGNNALRAHSLHYSQNCCRPARNHPGQHHINCKWADRFLEHYNPSHVIREEEKAKEQYVVCCCSPELPHDEGSKYRLLPKDSPFHAKVMFPCAKQTLELRNSYSRLTPPFLGKLTCGRHETIYTLMQWLTPKSTVRCVTLSGEARIGKTTVVKRASQYCFERHCFPDGIVYVDVTGRTFFDYFFSQMEKELQLGDIKNEKDLRGIIKRFTLLVIIDGMDSILDHDEESARKILTYLLDNTECPKFVLVSQRRFLLESASHLEVGPLKKADAAALLYSLAGELIKERKITLKELENHSIWDTIGCSPASVQLIAPLLKEKTLDKILAEHQEKHQALESRSAALQIIIDTLEHNQSAKELFKLLCHFPFGLLWRDVEMVCKEFPDWEMLLNYLVAEKNNVQRGSWCVKRINDIYEARHDISEYMSSKEPFISCVPVVAKHLAKIARSLVQVAGSMDSEQEGRSTLFQFDASLGVGLWTAAPQDIFPYEISIGNLHAVLERHERNFQHYTYRKSLEKLFPEYIPEVLIPYIVDIMLCVASLYIIMGKDNFMVTGYLDQCIITCEKYCLKRAYNILKLMRISIAYSDLRQVDKTIEQILTYFTQENCEEGKAECYLFRGLFKFVSHTRAPGSPTLKRCNTSENDYKSDLQLAKDSFAERKNDLGIARVLLVKSEAKSQTATKLSYVTHLQEAAASFSRHAKKTLQVRCLMLQLDFQTRMEAFEQARNTITEIQKLAKDNKADQRVLNEKIKLLYSRIQRKSRNVFSFFKSFPLVKRKVAGGYTRAGALCRFPSQFRENLLETISECNKVVNVRMDIGTRKNLRQCIESGTRILHISSEEFSTDSLFLENEDGSADIITISDISDHLFSNSLGIDKDTHGIEVVVLAVQGSGALAEAVHRTLRVAHVVGIEFTDYPTDADASNTQKLYQDAINVFCVHFYRKVIEGETIRAAFKFGCQYMEENIYPYRTVVRQHARDEYDDIVVVRGGPVLIDQTDPIHDRHLFTTEHTDIFHTEILLQDGTFQDLSPPRAPTNLRKMDSYTGRQELLFNTIKDLKTRRCVHITGQPGSGRTAFLTYLGYHLCMRHKYSDGIYYIDCGGGKSINERLRDQGLISSVEQLNDLSNKKDLLLLLDDCDSLIQSSPNQFQSLLSQLVNRYEVSVLFSSVVNVPDREELSFKRSKLTPLSCDERAAMILSRNTSLTLEQIDPHHLHSSLAKALADHRLLKQSMGLPKKIMEIDFMQEGRLQTPSECSRKASVEFGDVDVNDILENFRFSRENSTTAEEEKAFSLQDRLEDLKQTKKSKGKWKS